MNIFDKILETVKGLLSEDLSDTDLGRELDTLAEGSGLNWRESVVDFLRLLEIDASRANRDELSVELSVTDGEPGSPERNESLRKAVFRKLAENGGKVPDSLLD